MLDLVSGSQNMELLQVRLRLRLRLGLRLRILGSGLGLGMLVLGLGSGLPEGGAQRGVRVGEEDHVRVEREHLGQGQDYG